MSNIEPREESIEQPRKNFPIRLVARIGLCIAAIHPLASLGARYGRLFDLISHFEFPALLATLVALVASLFARARIASIALALLAVYQIEPFVRYDFAPRVSAEPGDKAPLRVLMSNVLIHNTNYEPLKNLIISENPDIVGLIEISPAWLEGLAAARNRYPYRYEAPSFHGATGIALWLRRKPISVDGPRSVFEGAWPHVEATIAFRDRKLTIRLVHPSNPLYRGAAGNPELIAIAQEMRNRSGSTLVLGDFNCTEGSPFWWDFIRISGLRDSRYGFGKQPSWPSGGTYRIPIDHAFVSNDLAVTRRELGPQIGSDHLPLLIEIAPAAARSISRSPRLDSQ